MITFQEVYNLLEKKGPEKAISSRNTEYKVEARNGNTLYFPKSGKGLLRTVLFYNLKS